MERARCERAAARKAVVVCPFDGKRDYASASASATANALGGRMNSKVVGLVAASLSILVACGDSSSSAGAGGSTGTTSSSKAAGTASSSTGMNCGMSTTKAACQTCCTTQEPAGSKKLVDKVADACGCQPAQSCTAQCAGEAFCGDHTSALGATCDACIKALGATAMCAASVAGSCGMDKECQAALVCAVGCVSLP